MAQPLHLGHSHAVSGFGTGHSHLPMKIWTRFCSFSLGCDFWPSPTAETELKCSFSPCEGRTWTLVNNTQHEAFGRDLVHLQGWHSYISMSFHVGSFSDGPDSHSFLVFTPPVACGLDLLSGFEEIQPLSWALPLLLSPWSFTPCCEAI